MDKESQIEGFIIEDERKFREEDILSLINRLKKFAKLIGKEGKVHIEDRSLSGSDMSRVFLIARYLGGELAKVKPELKLNKNMTVVNIQEFSDFLSTNNNSARARMSALCSEGFAKRITRGIIIVESSKIEGFINQLEKRTEEPEKVAKKLKKKKLRLTEKEVIKIDAEVIIEKLSSDINVEKEKLNDILFIKNDGTFKFNTMIGDSKYAKQKSCILCSGYILLIGFNKRTFSSRKLSDICYNSNIDQSDIAQTIKILKNQGFISKVGRGSQENIIREKGKKEARKILLELCK